MSTLERLVAAEVTHATTDLYEMVTTRLPPTLRDAIDLLVEVPEGDVRSSLFRLKDYPKSANAAVIKGDIVRLHLIEDLLGKGAGLDDLDPRIVRQLGQLGCRYDAGDLRRFAKPKRDALVACSLVEARQALLDQIVEMNDLFLTGMNRRSRTAVEIRRKSLRRRAALGCTVCSARSIHWWRPRARKPSPPCVRHSTHRPHNMATVRHMVMNLLRATKPGKSLKVRRKLAGWDPDYLHAVLQGTA